MSDPGAAFFIDMDGTLIHHHTEEPLEGAIEQVNAWYDAGHQIILTTRRGNDFVGGSRYNLMNTEKLLDTLGIKYHKIIYGVYSPRIIINDSGAYGMMVAPNKSWKPNMSNAMKELISEMDDDEYIETPKAFRSKETD